MIAHASLPIRILQPFCISSGFSFASAEVSHHISLSRAVISQIVSSYDLRAATFCAADAEPPPPFSASLFSLPTPPATGFQLFFAFLASFSRYAVFRHLRRQPLPPLMMAVAATMLFGCFQYYLRLCCPAFAVSRAAAITALSPANLPADAIFRALCALRRFQYLRR